MLDDQVTVLIPTSPIPWHPATEMIAEVLGGVRGYFPTARIIVMADGVRPHVEHRRAQYGEYLNALSARISSGEFGNTELWRAPDYSQQAMMTRENLKRVTTPFILFVEHDAVLTGINDWEAIIHLLQSGQANMVRFYHWDRIWWEHEYLMRGEFTFEGVQFVRTVQFSGWPNIATKSYYEDLLTRYFAPSDRKMIEPPVYGPISNAPWEQNKIVIYYPEKANTFLHRNGRAGADGQRDQADW